MSNNCYKPNINNPMGNFMPFDARDKMAVCNVSQKEHLNNLVQSSDLVDETFKLNFNPNPVTTSYPDISGFANYLFPDPARCRSTGYLCKTNVDKTFNLDRIGYDPNDKKFQLIDPSNAYLNSFKIGGHTN
jgi:hypothetical protein